MALKDFDRVLKTSDFIPMANRPANADGTENAQIHPEIRPSKFKMKRDGKAASIASLDVKVDIVSADTWMLTSKLSDADLLDHEQRHYDITALAAREMYEKLLSLKEESVHELQTAMTNAQAEIQARLKVVDKRYDDQTNHGINRAQQAVWNRMIDAEKLKANGGIDQLPS